MATTGSNQNQQTVLLNVQMNTQQATQAVTQLGAAVTAVGQTPIGTQSVQTYRQAIRDAQQELERLGRTRGVNSQEFVTASAALQTLRNDYDELQIASNSLNGDNKLRGLGTAAQGATAALQGVTGAMAFFGASSEDAAVITAKLQGLMAFSGALDGIGDLKDGYNSFLRMLGLNITAATTQNAVQATGVATTTAATASTVAQTSATVGQTTATNTATVATRGLGFAMKALGIGLVVSALGYLVTNWNSVTSAMNRMLPAGKSVSGIFNNIKSMAMGVGSAIMQYIATPFKAISSLLQGDMVGFKKALTDGFNLKKNYTDGFNKQELSNVKIHNENLAKENIKSQERELERQKNRGKNVEAQELALQKRKLSLLQKGTKDYDEQLHKIEDLQDAHYKKVADDNQKANDKAAATQKTYTDKALKERETANAKKKESDEKAKAQLEKDREDGVKFIEDANRKTLLQYDADILEIKKKRDDLLGRAGISGDDKVKIKGLAQGEIDKINAKQNAINTDSNAQTNLINTDKPSDNDTPEVAALKINNLAAAKRLAENAAFELKKLDLVGQKEQLILLEANHAKSLVDIEKEATDAKIKLSESEKEAKLNNVQAISGALSSVGQLVGESTVAGKGISIATATMDTYAGATKALAQGGIFGYVGAAGIIASGLANVKKIMSVKIPSQASQQSAPSISAPVINSTILTQANSGITDLRADVSNKNTQPIKAYIVDKDLETQKSRSEFLSRLSQI